MEAVLTGISGMLFVNILLSVLWLSTPRGVRSCGCRRGLGSRLGLLGLFAFSFFAFRFRLNAKMITQNPKRKTSPAGLLGLILVL